MKSICNKFASLLSLKYSIKQLLLNIGNVITNWDIIKSSSGPCHEDPGDPVSFNGFYVVDYSIT